MGRLIFVVLKATLAANRQRVRVEE